MGFEICRLIGNPRIAGGMTLIESIRSELLPVSPYLLQHLRVVAVFLSAFYKHRLHLVNDGLLLLTHRLTKGVALTSGEVGKLSGQKHHLLLIYRNTVCILEVFLHTRNVVFYLLLAVLTGNK